MCIAAIALDAHPRWRLVVAANRDEFHDRPAAPLARWADEPAILAGRDLKGGGTWLGVSATGRLVLVTNFRVPGYPLPDRPSRGSLVTGLLLGDDPEKIAIDKFNPFSLLVADSQGSLQLLGNYPGEQRLHLPNGVHGLSNGAFVPPWPKTRRLVGAVDDWIGQAGEGFSPLFHALRDESPHDSPGDGPLPHLSGVFIKDPVYGTRCSTVIAIDRDGHGQIVERRFGVEGETTGETSLDFSWGR